MEQKILRILEKDEKLIKGAEEHLGLTLFSDEDFKTALLEAFEILENANITNEQLKDTIVSCIVLAAEEITNQSVKFENATYNLKDRKIDRILTGKLTGIPIMILLLGLIFWITINGANIPSQLLSDFLFSFEDDLLNLCLFLKFPTAFSEMLVFGIYRVLAWVVSVMLPPMAIFFPLFTILEDLGFLPRIAFNLDRCFKKCHTCGKQALTMCMGFGCNAVGVTGCRIIDSPRERLIAILTNSFIPCNGRFPTLIAIFTIFFSITSSTILNITINVLLLTLVILIAIFIPFIVSKVLSKTILKGETSFFILELPPYRKPQIGIILIRSLIDRTLKILLRSIIVAAPAGIMIWLLTNVKIFDVNIFNHMANFLNPFALIIGLDGIILASFILGFPANEIVVPIMIMGYMATNNLTEFNNLVELKELLVNNGWTWVTALCFIIFSLFHFPCSTTCLTIKKETGSLKWTIFSIILPTIIGIIICFIVNNIFNL